MASNSRPKEEAAFVAAVRAVHALVEAREAAVQALTDLADSLIHGDPEFDFATFDELLERPFGKVLGWYHPQTFALLGEIASTRAYLADSGAGSGFEFESLLTNELLDVSGAFALWLANEGAQPSSVDALLDAFDDARDHKRLADALRRELDALAEQGSFALATGDDGV